MASLKQFEAIYCDTFDPELHSIWLGHGVTLDLKVMGIYDVPYYDTHIIDREPTYNNTRKLKTLSEKHLNAQIQEGHHSSIIDSRASLALFLKLKDVYAIELDGPSFVSLSDAVSGAAKRRRKKNHPTAANTFGRQAFKHLDAVPGQEPKPFNLGLKAEEEVTILCPFDAELQKLIASCSQTITKNRKYVVNKT